MNTPLSSFRVIVETLTGNPLRTFLSTLGMVTGVASLVAVLSLGDSMQQFMRDQIGETTDLQVMSVAPKTSRDLATTPGTPVKPGDSITIGGARYAVVGILGVSQTDRTVSMIMPTYFARVSPESNRRDPSRVNS